MLPLDRPLLDEIALAAGGVGVVGLLSALVANVRVSRLRRGFSGLDGDGKATVLDSVRSSAAETAALRSEVAKARADVDAARRDLADALRHVSVVRYDAFGDMGGRLSFTVALLDDAGDGVLVTAIHGRSESRTYAKGVKGGASEQTLSPEEQQAVELALRGPARA